MKKTLIALLFSGALFGQTHNLQNFQTYMGQEFHNGKFTGQTCYVIVDYVNENAKGKHCHDIQWRYASNRDDVPSHQALSVSSRITNYHRREYPNLKTCAMNQNGTTGGDEIYSDNTSNLVNDIFNGGIKEGRNEYHLFLSLSRKTKNLTSARIHGLRWFKEWDVDCKNLKLLN